MASVKKFTLRHQPRESLTHHFVTLGYGGAKAKPWMQAINRMLLLLLLLLVQVSSPTC
jgi:hypothetical protein